MLCRKCGTPANTGQKFCTECGNTLEHLDLSVERPTSPKDIQENRYRVEPMILKEPKTSDSREVFSKWVVGIFVFVAFWIVITVIVAQNYTASPSLESPAPTRSAPTSPTPTAEPTSWFPKNYKLLTDNVAYKKIKNSDCDISIAHSCYQMYVVVNKPCKLFVRANFLIEDVVIDDALDSVTLNPGQRGIMTFGSITAASYEGSKQIQFTDVTCY
jgi:hypothetical protein